MGQLNFFQPMKLRVVNLTAGAEFALFSRFCSSAASSSFHNKPSCDIAKSSFFLSEYKKIQFFGNKKNTLSARKKTSQGKEEEKVSLSVKKSCFAVRNKSQ